MQIFSRVFNAEIYQTFKEEMTTIILNLFQKSKTKETWPNLFCEDSVILIVKHTNKEDYRSIYLMNIGQNIK